VEEKVNRPVRNYYDLGRILMIETAAGVGMSLIASEHFFSTFLSSPWTTGKFAETEEDKAKIRKYYMLACATSLITAFILGAILKQKWPVIATLVLCVMYIAVYEAAMRGKI
jgi:hypothetical protein